MQATKRDGLSIFVNLDYKADTRKVPNPLRM